MILYLIYGFGMVTCTVSPLSRFTVRLTDEWVGVFLARRSVQHLVIFEKCLLHGDLYRVSPFQVYRTSTSCLPHDLEFFMFAIMKTFVTDISASTGRNDFIFDIWLLHGDLYRVYPFQVYRTSTSCLPCDLEFFMFAVIKTFVTDISASTGRNDFIFDIWLWHGDLYSVSPFQVTVITKCFCL